MKVIYPVCFYEEKNGYSVEVPDLSKALNTNACTCGDTLEEALYMAEDLIAGLILDEIEHGRKIPISSKIEDIQFDEDDEVEIVSKFKSYIIADISEFAEKWGKESVKKTLSIPKWLNSKAEKLNINFSKTLQEALLEKISK